MAVGKLTDGAPGSSLLADSPPKPLEPRNHENRCLETYKGTQKSSDSLPGGLQADRLEVVDDVVAVELHDGVAWYVAHAIAGSSARAAATANLT